jgi:CopG antitoxin of type II toxin-antitoxin system
MTQKEGQIKEPLPEFQSREDMAEFWDTHDFTDYMDEFKPAKVRFAKNLSEGITIRFDPQTLAELRSRAKKAGHRPDDPGSYVGSRAARRREEPIDVTVSL